MILKIKINNYEINNIKLLKLINFIIYVIFNNNNIKINIIFIFLKNANYYKLVVC